MKEASVAVAITAKGGLSSGDEQMFKNDDKCVPWTYGSPFRISGDFPGRRRQASSGWTP